MNLYICIAYLKVANEFTEEKRVTTRNFHEVSRNFWNYLIENLHIGDSVLELGSGNGWLRDNFEWPAINYHCVDITSSMKSVSNRVNGIVASARCIPIEGKSIDYVVASLADPYFYPEVLCEVNRILKDEALFVAILPDKEWADNLRGIGNHKTTFLLDQVNSDKYNGNAMSDGERAIFHYIGEVVSAKDNSLIIIDEPENHLHNSILEKLWNEIEAERQDCVYLYITHNLDFARSRNNAQIIWVKNMLNKQKWDFELLNSDEFSDDLLLEILGNRQGVLFIEGTPDKSIDRKLYSKLFLKYSIMPLEGCASVIQATKSYNKLPMLHYKTIKGIVDRDRRTEDEINSLLQDKIYVPSVAEIENLFLIPQVIELVARKQSIENVDVLLEQTKEKTIEFLKLHLEEQALLFTKKRCQNTINNVCNQSTQTIDEYKTSLDEIVDKIKPQEEYSKACKELQKIVDDKDYIAALRVINNKGLLPFTNVSNAFGWKKQHYIDYVIRLLGTQDNTSEELCNIFRNYVSVGD